MISFLCDDLWLLLKEQSYNVLPFLVETQFFLFAL